MKVSTVIILWRLRIIKILCNISKENRLLSGDIELHPGPVTNNGTLSRSIANPQADFVLNYRLLRHGLRPLDQGGEGDCFFKSITSAIWQF